MKSFYAQKWLDTAKWAASGGNAQPWAAEYDEKPTGVTVRLTISNAYKGHPSAMDKGGEASAMALGCLAFNLEVMANLDKFQMSHKLWDLQKSFWDCSVTLFFKPNAEIQTKFSMADLVSRKTDRTPYQKVEIPGIVLKEIRLIVRQYEVLEYFEFSTNKKLLASAFIEIEKIRWKNSELLSSLLAEVSFGKEEKTVLDKIPASQLGVPFMDTLLLRTIRLFPRLAVFFKWGFHQIASRKAISNYIKHSDSLFFIQAKNNDFECCYELGKCFQEIWLACNQKGIGFQPLGLPLIPLAFWNHPDALTFTPAEENKLEQITQELINKFEMDLRVPMMGLRIGIPTQNPKKSPRKEFLGILNSGLSNTDFSDSNQNKRYGI